MNWSHRFLAGLILGCWGATSAGEALEILPETGPGERVVGAAEPGKAAPAVSATLRWHNGETLAGEVIEASGENLAWKTAIFEAPLLLGWKALRRIDSPQESVSPVDPFSIALRNGSHLYGDLVSITDDAVAIRSSRHGDVRLKRAAILTVRRYRGESVAFAGPAGDFGWITKSPPSSGRAVTRAAAVSEITTGPGGALLLPYWNVGARLDLPLPESVLMEFKIRASKRLDFQLALTGDAKQRLRLETWGDMLVLGAGLSFSVLRDLPTDALERALKSDWSRAFASLRNLPENTQTLALRIGWNRKTGHCAVFTPEGEKLAEWQAPEDVDVKAADKQGLLLQNKGRDLTLEYLKIRAWDGSPPPPIDRTQPRLALADGRVILGRVGNSTDGAVLLQPSGEGDPLSFPFAEISEIVFSGDAPETADTGTTMVYADGTLLFGRIASIKQGAAALEVPFVEGPLSTRMEALRLLLLEPADADAAREPSFDTLDKLVVSDVTLHGQLSGGGDSVPEWLPVGGVRSAKLTGNARAEISRALPADAEVPGAPALFYLRQGDVLPGTLRSLDRNGVEIESTITATRKLSAEDLDGIYFGGTTQTRISGFNDAGWRVVKGNEKTVVRTHDSVTLEPDTALGHPRVMQSHEITFQMGTTSFGALRMRLFCNGTDPGKSVNVILMRMGDRITYGVEEGEGQVDEQSQTRVPGNDPVPVRLVVSDTAVTLHLNEVEVRSLPIPSAKRSGYGLVLEPGSMWGNPVQQISLSAFSAISQPGGAWVPEVNPETRMQTLTVPRFRKETPPRHVLIAANGDLLRGEIEAMTSTHIGFRSGLETLRIPRDRVKAAVWLKKPAEGQVGEPVVGTRPKWFEQVLQNRTRFSGATLSSLLNYIRSQVPELKFKLPSKPDNQRQPMSFTQQTVGATLDQIATAFDVRYTIDETGTLVFQGGRPTIPTLAERVYWLKTGQFPGPESVQEVLTAKGVTFAKDASAKWQPARQQLIVVNTPENLKKVDEILTAEFGEGSFVSPTHWLQLANGARLGLKVESFHKDFVEGEHPVYGRCRIPLAEIFSVRTSSPTPTPAMVALGGWQLTYAPEPVLPETGGESSPILSKEAKPFKLPLLGGGEFELAKEQGKVVVLDFWATWCGPCVKSLPGLMATMAEFSPEQVKFIGVNQGEPPDTVKRFLETRGWKLTVALDASQTVGRDYGVEGIPHTVIIAPDGKVAWVKTGFTPTLDKEVSDTVKRLLNPVQVAAAPAGE